ncbi:MAG: hypothetical protein ACOZCO_16960 [Bacteroidota bacterium]
MSEPKNKNLKPGDVYEIPVEGSLGLLALGYRGVQAWRKVRNEAIKKEKEKKEQGNDKGEK